ncbi:rCG36334 [Rattus norvegicus]|uniref:RCG36334 n=1 Tax=Rattus norvegicus TaxID=10116 RepID=A6IQA4_RAT|nr:rCG36334 [Rattus norvegicus]
MMKNSSSARFEKRKGYGSSCESRYDDGTPHEERVGSVVSVTSALQ